MAGLLISIHLVIVLFLLNDKADTSGSHSVDRQARILLHSDVDVIDTLAKTQAEVVSLNATFNGK